MARVARTALKRFGGFDAWVNNAGVSAYGKLWNIPIEDRRRLCETNHSDVVHGSLKAVRRRR